MTLYEFSQTVELFYLVTEYCAGGELRARIDALQRFSEHLAARVMKQLLSAVAYCHRQRVVHRDLKPENVVFESPDPASCLKVIDFDTSRVLDSSATMREVAGTVRSGEM